MRELAPYRKAIIAALAILFGMLANSAEDGLSLAEVLASVAGMLSGGTAVFAVPNAPLPTKANSTGDHY